MKRVRVASKMDIPSDRLLAVEVDGVQVALCQAYGYYYAVSEFCSHDEASLAEEGLMEENCIVCELHGSKFDPQTGKVLGLPATLPLKTYQVVEEGEDLYMVLDEVRSLRPDAGVQRAP